MNRKELLEKAKSLGMSGYSKLPKAELEALVAQHNGARPVQAPKPYEPDVQIVPVGGSVFPKVIVFVDGKCVTADPVPLEERKFANAEELIRYAGTQYEDDLEGQAGKLKAFAAEQYRAKYGSGVVPQVAADREAV